MESQELTFEERRAVVGMGLGLWGEALDAVSDEAAIASARADLEVLSRDELLQLAVVLAAWAPRRWIPPALQGKVRQRVAHHQLELKWAES